MSKDNLNNDFSDDIDKAIKEFGEFIKPINKKGEEYIGKMFETFDEMGKEFMNQVNEATSEFTKKNEEPKEQSKGNDKSSDIFKEEKVIKFKDFITKSKINEDKERDGKDKKDASPDFDEAGNLTIVIKNLTININL